MNEALAACVATIAVEDARWNAIVADADAALMPLIGATVRDALGTADLGEICVVLADDDTVRDLNRRFRGVDRPTNVLSFPISDAGEQPVASGVPAMLGDVYVAFETASAEAANENKDLADHLGHLVVHGVLHLLGYDHLTDADAETMERLEARILGQFGIRDPYDPERAAPIVAPR